MQNGDSDHRLLSEVLVILKARGCIDLDAAIERLVWKNARAYRVAITVADEDIDDVFGGYPEVIVGDVLKRRSEVLHLKNMRRWMSAIAAKARVCAEEIAGAHVR